MNAPTNDVLATGPATIENLRRALAADRVLSYEQIKRHFSSNGDSACAGLSGYASKVLLLAPTKHAQEKPVPVCGEKELLEKAHPSAIRHLLLTAEVRNWLKADPDTWELHAQTQSLSNADAYWLRDGNRIPIEVDVGYYSKGRILHKIRAYANEAPQQIWASPSNARLEQILAHARALNVANLHALLLPFP